MSFTLRSACLTRGTAGGAMGRMMAANRQSQSLCASGKSCSHSAVGSMRKPLPAHVSVPASASAIARLLTLSSSARLCPSSGHHLQSIYPAAHAALPHSIAKLAKRTRSFDNQNVNLDTYAHAHPHSHRASFCSCAARPAQTASVGRDLSSGSAQQHRSRSSSHSDEDADGGGEGDPEPEPRSFKERMRYLWKRYGWWALGVYQLWSFVDVSLTFAAIHLLGADHIRKLESRVREWAGIGKRQMKDEDVAAWPLEMPSAQEEGKTKGHLKENNSQAARSALRLQKAGARAQQAADDASTAQQGGGGRAADSKKSTDKAAAATAGGGGGGEEEGEGMISAAVWTELVLAYTIHKTLLLPFRVALTAAVTPAFVKQMVKLGWAKPNTAVQAANKAKAAAAATAAATAKAKTAAAAKTS